MEIDVHGYTRIKASEIIKEKIIECYKNNITTLNVIHGSNNGTAIRDWLRASKTLPSEVVSVTPHIINPCDITTIKIKLKG